MYNNVTKKFNETIFFFNYMQKAFEKMDPFCDYFVSAFLSAARSVTFMIQVEQKEWWEKNYSSLPENFGKFHDLRVISVHQKPVGVTYKITTEFPSGLTMAAGEVVNIPINLQSDLVQIIKTGKKGVAGIQKRDLLISEYRKDKKTEIKFENFMEEVNKYISELGKIVKDYEDTFISPVS